MATPPELTPVPASEADKAKAEWIVDFLLRQPISDAALCDLLRSVPIFPSPSLIRPFVVRFLLSRLRIPYTPGALRPLDLLLSLRLADGGLRRPPPDGGPRWPKLFSAAYLAVASAAVAGAGAFPDAVAVVFGQHVRRLLGSQEATAAGLEVEKMRDLADEMEAAVNEPVTREWVMAGDKQADAASALRALLIVEMAELGPSFLESVAELLAGDGPETDELWRSASDEQILSLLLLVGDDRGNAILSKIKRDTTISDALPTLEVTKLANDLKTSCNDLHDTVDDPLPAALKTAADVLTTSNKSANLTTGEVVPVASSEGSKGAAAGKEPQQGRRGQPEVETHVGDAGRGVATSDGEHHGADADGIKDDQRRIRRSLMDWNPTAHEYEWDDSIDTSSDSLPAVRPRLHTPNTRLPSPLKVMQIKVPIKRRKSKKWSILEEDTLRKAVAEIGRGSWKQILLTYPNIFEERTEVDLKDKWRNLTKYH